MSKAKNPSIAVLKRPEGAERIGYEGETVANALRTRAKVLASASESFAGRPVIDGQRYSVGGFYSDVLMQMPDYIAKAAYSKDLHDGCLFISPTVPPVSQQAGATLRERRDNFLNGVGETDPGGTGVFVAMAEVVCPEQYGAFGDGVELDTQAVKSALNGQGYRVIGKPGAVYLMDGQADISSQCQWYLAGATVRFELTSYQAGLYAKADFVEIHGGTVAVIGSGGAETGGNGHSLNCITIGEQLTGAGWKSFKFHDLVVSTNRTDAGAHIGVMGECSRGEIYNITAPDNPTARNVIGLEWGGNAGGVGETGHPHNISVKNINVGKMTFGGSFSSFGYVCWVSACFNISIENIFMEEGYGLVAFYAGDKANDFAPARYKKLVGTGLTLRNAGIEACSGVAVSCIGTGNSTATILPMKVKVDGLTATVKAGAADTRGVDGEQFESLEIRRFKLSGFRYGTIIRALGNNFTLQDGEVSDCGANGSYVGAAGAECYNPVIRNVRYKRNNQSGGTTAANAAVRLINTTGGGIIGCTFGEEGQIETQKYSVSVESTCRDIELSGNFTWDHVAGGFSYIIGGTADTQINAHGRNNKSAAGVDNHAGAPIFDIQQDGTRHFVDDGIPTNGTYEVGDKVWFTAPAAAGWLGATCVVAGGPGVYQFKRFGQIEA